MLINTLGIPTKHMMQQYGDVKPDKWYFDYINTASSLGIVNGFSKDEFKPGSNITRGQMAAMIVRAFDDTVAFPYSVGQVFPDVPDNYRFSEEINKAAALGIIQGNTDNTFKARNLANRAQAVVVMYRAVSSEEPLKTTENDVISVIKNYLTAEGNTDDYDTELGILDQYTMGYYYAYAFNIVAHDHYLEESEGYDITLSGDASGMQATVSFLSDRFAEVTVTGTKSYIKSLRPDGTVYENTSLQNDGYYYLRNVEGVWKIYNQSPSE